MKDELADKTEVRALRRVCGVLAVEEDRQDPSVKVATVFCISNHSSGATCPPTS